MWHHFKDQGDIKDTNSEEDEYEKLKEVKSQKQNNSSEEAEN